MTKRMETMTDAEFEELWKRVKERDHREAEDYAKKIAKLSPKEKERERWIIENSRLWEDYTDEN